MGDLQVGVFVFNDTLNCVKNKVTEAIRRAKKNFFYESFRENRGDSKKIWSALKDLTGQKNHGGVSYLEENRSIYKYAMKLQWQQHQVGPIIHFN